MSWRRELSREQIGGVPVEGSGDPKQMQDGEVSYAALDAAHVATADPCGIGERFLGDPPLSAESPNASAQALQCGVLGRFPCGPRHARHAGWMRPLGPRPIGYYVR